MDPLSLLCDADKLRTISEEQIEDSELASNAASVASGYSKGRGVGVLLSVFEV